MSESFRQLMIYDNLNMKSFFITSQQINSCIANEITHFASVMKNILFIKILCLYKI
jgi:hypothetical protein